MFGLSDGMRYYVCQRYVRMNLGINGLYKLVSQEMDLPPLSGAVFIFFSKNRQQVKLLRWDTGGFTLYQKRNLRDTIFQPRQEGLCNALQDPIRHYGRNIVEVGKISQEAEYWQFYICKCLIISNIIVKIHDYLFGSLVFFSYF